MGDGGWGMKREKAEGKRLRGQGWGFSLAVGMV
jgi:hypothetical protein